MKLLAHQVVALLSLAALQASAYTLYNTQPYYVAKPVGRSTQAQQCQPLPAPMVLLAERACGSPGALSEMPLVVVAQDSLQVVRDGQAQVRVSALNSQLPYAAIASPALPQGDVQALRAVRVELRQPVYVSSLQSTLPFPDSFIVVHGADGAAAPLAIRTVIAPVPAGTVLSPAQPFAVRVLYAVPLDPLHAPAPAIQAHSQPAYNYYASNYYTDAPLYHPQPEFLGYGYDDHHQQLLVPQRQPAPPQQQFQVHFQQRPQYQVQQVPSQLPQRPTIEYQGVQQTQRPLQSQRPLQPQLPLGLPQAVQADGSKKPGANLVTILDFPSAIATPESLFYQPEDPDSELGNRQPPQAVSPAGIVQSTQPQPNLSVFINSKESAVLQGLRDEAEKEKEMQRLNRLVQFGVRAESVNPELESISVDAVRPQRSSAAQDAPAKASSAANAAVAN